MVWHACSIPLFRDDRPSLVRAYYPLHVFIIDWLLMFVNQTQVGADLTRHNCTNYTSNFDKILKVKKFLKK